MEPQLPPPHSSPENPAFLSRPRTPEAPSVGGQEKAPLQERGEQQESREQQSGVGRGDVAAFPQPLSQPAPSQSKPQDDVKTSHLTDDMPLTAADEDLIEMEWVNKAKKIVNQTKTDPYVQEREVSKLQANYQHKRYGKELKLPKEE